MARIPLLALLIAALVSLSSASSAPTFCKCTCFKNSTIIALGPEHEPAATPAISPLRRSLASFPGQGRHIPHLPVDHSRKLKQQRRDDGDDEPKPDRDAPLDNSESDAEAAPEVIEEPKRRAGPASCAVCTKAFCLDQGLDICEDATEDDVVTTCFQRDSNQDKIIVWGFIIGTLGLLIWAAFKRLVQWRQARSIGRQDVNYTPIREHRQ